MPRQKVLTNKFVGFSPTKLIKCSTRHPLHCGVKCVVRWRVKCSACSETSEASRCAASRFCNNDEEMKWQYTAAALSKPPKNQGSILRQWPDMQYPYWNITSHGLPKMLRMTYSLSSLAVSLVVTSARSSMGSRFIGTWPLIDIKMVVFAEVS